MLNQITYIYKILSKTKICEAYSIIFELMCQIKYYFIDIS